MTVTSKWGMEYQALLDVGFQQDVFTLGGYATTTTRTNLVTNPSFETNATGWSGAQSGGVTRSTSFAFSGSASGLVTMSSTTDSNVAFITPTFNGTGNVTFSAYFYIPIGSTLAGRTISISRETGTATQTFVSRSNATLVAGSWARASVIYNISAAGTMTMVSRLSGTLSTAVGQTIYVDSVLAEFASSALPYFDGTTADPYTGYALTSQAWNGTANNSTSTATWVAGVTRTNLLTNPSLETNQTAWIASGAGVTSTRDTTVAYSGSASFRMDYPSTTATPFAIAQPGFGSLRLSVTPGQDYTFSAYVRTNDSDTHYAQITWATAVTGGSTTLSQGTGVVLPANTWVRLSVSAACPVGYSFAQFVIVRLTNTATASTWVDAALVETGSTVLPYFDGGEVQPYSGYTLISNTWNGTVNNSTSTAQFGLTSDLTGSTLDGPDWLDGRTSFVDITQYVQNININRGRSTQLEVFNAGTLNLQANDQQANRAFDPLNTASPWYQGNLGIAPRRKIKIVAGTADLFNGYVYDLDIIYDQPNLSFAQISAVDALAQLSQTTLNAFTPPNEFSSDRIATILDRGEVGFGTATVPRQLNQSISSCGSVAYEAGTNTLKALQDVQIGENGRFFVTREGIIRFDPRVTASFATATATFGGTATGAIPISGLENVYGAETVVNRASVQIAGSTAVSVADGTASQALYGVRSLALFGLPLDTDAAGSALAESLIDQYQNPEVRFTGLTVNMAALSSAQQDLVAAIEIGDVVDVSKEFAAGSPTTVTKTVVVEAVRHSVSSNRHDVSLSLAPVRLLFPLVLDDSVFGLLDSTNALT